MKQSDLEERERLRKLMEERGIAPSEFKPDDDLLVRAVVATWGADVLGLRILAAWKGSGKIVGWKDQSPIKRLCWEMGIPVKNEKAVRQFFKDGRMGTVKDAHLKITAEKCQVSLLWLETGDYDPRSYEVFPDQKNVRWPICLNDYVDVKKCADGYQDAMINKDWDSIINTAAAMGNDDERYPYRKHIHNLPIIYTRWTEAESEPIRSNICAVKMQSIDWDILSQFIETAGKRHAFAPLWLKAIADRRALGGVSDGSTKKARGPGGGRKRRSAD